MADFRLLQLLSNKYPNKKAAMAEVTNLSAILSLPKGTEYFYSDLHGEAEAFIHMVKSASGTIKNKIDELFKFDLDYDQREELAAIVYDAKSQIELKKKDKNTDFNEWCSWAIYFMVKVCKSVSTKYTRSKVRRKLPENIAYIMDELLHADDEENRAKYYETIISSIVEVGIAEDFIIQLADTTGRLATDQLHIIGDVWDRGSHPEVIMDYLMTFEDVDFQWGNHDIVWMGAADGNWPCIANILRMNISYNNFDMLEVGYGFNLRGLASFAEKVYADDPCTKFMPHIIEECQYDKVPDELAAKMHKAIAIIQFKIEGQCIKAHPEYNLDKRLLLDKMDLKKGTVNVEGKEYKLNDTNFPTVDPKDPYKLTKEEKEVMEGIEASILNSTRLQSHIRFMYSHGSLYKIVNGNLLYHGCMPSDKKGNFKEVTINGKTAKGEALMKHLDAQVREAHFSPDKTKKDTKPSDLMWFMWLNGDSPLFGKDKMTTFERLFIDDKESHKEITTPYYTLINEKKYCEKILNEFNLDPSTSKILNGHVPVKLKDGESPIKGDGLLFVIDGGISKAYQKKTGIAGYTFIFNSRFMALAEHEPYIPKKEDGTQVFCSPRIYTVETLKQRMLIKDTDMAKEIINQKEELLELAKAYSAGLIKERDK